MTTETHRHDVRVYYEDTDFSGAVYHANYLKWFERAREHLLGPEELVRLWHEGRVGFVVYKVELTFREAGRFGDAVQIRTTVRRASPWRLVFDQHAVRAVDDVVLCAGVVELVCVGGDGKLTPLPPGIAEALAAGATAAD